MNDTATRQRKISLDPLKLARCNAYRMHVPVEDGLLIEQPGPLKPLTLTH